MKKPYYEEDNLIYFEDALLTRQIVYTIEEKHNLYVNKIFRHVFINGYEIDALAICKTREDKFERWIGFELKENSLDKAIHQAILRRRFFNYFYIVINLSVSSIVRYLLDMADKIKESKIGIISAYDSAVVLKSNFRKKEDTLPLMTKREIDPTQLRLIHFLKENEKRWPLSMEADNRVQR